MSEEADEGEAAEDREQEGEEPGGVPEEVPVQEPEPERTGEDRTRVYVTHWGKRWHRIRQCQGLLSARRVDPTTRTAAERGGYSACRYCG